MKGAYLKTARAHSTGRGGVAERASLTLKPEVAKNHVIIHSVKWGNEPGGSGMPSLLKWSADLRFEPPQRTNDYALLKQRKYMHQKAFCWFISFNHKYKTRHFTQCDTADWRTKRTAYSKFVIGNRHSTACNEQCDNHLLLSTNTAIINSVTLVKD